MFTCPIVRSGLCSLAIRPSHCQPLTAFHRKTLRSFLHFSCRSPVPSLHFLLGELPIEARLHRDTFSLFYAIWTNPQTKIFQLTKFLLSTCNDNSRTWAVHVRHLAKMYGLPDPLVMLNGTPPSKDSWKGDINTLITAYHEKQLRDAAATNSKMTWLNVSMLGLQGKPHPIFRDVSTADQVRKLYPVLKMLSGEYLTFDLKSRQGTGGSPSCRLCHFPVENLQHVLS